MDFIKKHWLYLTLGLVAVASIGTAAWAYMAGDSIIENMTKISSFKSQFGGEKSNAQNSATIEAQKAAQAALIAKQESLLAAALKSQTYNEFEGRERQCLVPGALPDPTSDGVKFAFKVAYAKAHTELYRRLHGGVGATPEDIANEQRIEDAKETGGGAVNRGPWAPKQTAEAEPGDEGNSGGEKSITEVLRSYPKARAIEKKARELYIYVDADALPLQGLVSSQDAPTTAEIWYAQMTLWIQQDIVEALARVNDKRAESLRSAGQAYDCWVAHMPVKHLKMLAGDAALGKGGGLMGRFRGEKSFTNIQNDATKFMDSLQLQVVVEEAAVMDVLDSICRIGYYTPVRVNYRRVESNPMQDDHIYGNEPVVELLIDIEAYYFRKVYDAWIPKELSPALTKPKGIIDENMRGGRG